MSSECEDGVSLWAQVQEFLFEVGFETSLSMRAEDIQLEIMTLPRLRLPCKLEDWF